MCVPGLHKTNTMAPWDVYNKGPLKEHTYDSTRPYLLYSMTRVGIIIWWLALDYSETFMRRAVYHKVYVLKKFLKINLRD